MIRAVNSIALIVAAVLAVALYRAKTEAHDARERVDSLTMMVEEERRQAAVLRAEIAFLERPERLRALAARHLGLEPTQTAQEVMLEDVLLALGTEGPALDAPDPGNPNLRMASQDAAPAPAAAPPAAQPAPEPAPEPAPRTALASAEDSAPPPAVIRTSSPAAPAPPPATIRVAEQPLPPAPAARQTDDAIAQLILTGGHAE